MRSTPNIRAGKAFLHSHSYTGNPIACRAALATLSVFRDEPVLERNRTLAAHLAKRIAPLAAHPNVGDVRQTGMIAAVEVVRDKTTRDAVSGIRAPWIARLSARPRTRRRAAAARQCRLFHAAVLRYCGGDRPHGRCCDRRHRQSGWLKNLAAVVFSTAWFARIATFSRTRCAGCSRVLRTWRYRRSAVQHRVPLRRAGPHRHP